VVTLDEFEAIRLADREGLKQEEAAEKMQISRPTFGRVLEAARRKVADALVEGLPLRIGGGAVCTAEGCGPRDCPRWRHAQPIGEQGARVAPCGRSFGKTHPRQEKGQ
jgi:hypothetical protein